MFAAVIVLGVFLVREGGFSSPTPAFSLPEPDGGQVDLASYAGRPVLLVFWTTSCPICQRELPMLNQMEPEFRSRGISVLTICLGGEEEARSYLDSKRIGLRSVYDERGRVGHAYHVSGVPGLVLIGKDGKVKRSTAGWTSDRVLRDWMDAS
jgi:cytochrome c biogenesis protein CcmG/thiol:disulfide interchange protein DsbE